MAISAKGAERRKARVRKALKARAFGRPRLSVFRSDKNIYAQIIDDANGRTLAAASTLDKDVKGTVKNGGSAEAAAIGPGRGIFNGWRKRPGRRQLRPVRRGAAGPNPGEPS